jgi:hypothetical protein
MHAHHRKAIEHVTSRMQEDPEVLALLLGGSIAHGFAGPASDSELNWRDGAPPVDDL